MVLCYQWHQATKEHDVPECRIEEKRSINQPHRKEITKVSVFSASLQGYRDRRKKNRLTLDDKITTVIHHVNRGIFDIDIARNMWHCNGRTTYQHGKSIWTTRMRQSPRHPYQQPTNTRQIPWTGTTPLWHRDSTQNPDATIRNHYHQQRWSWTRHRQTPCRNVSSIPHRKRQKTHAEKT